MCLGYLEAALKQFREIAADLGANGITKENEQSGSTSTCVG